jgi:hypothetical protein
MNTIIFIAVITVATILIGWLNPKFDRIEKDGSTRIIMWYTPLFKKERHGLTVYDSVRWRNGK